MQQHRNFYTMYVEGITGTHEVEVPSDSDNVVNSDIRLLCDTSGGAVTINLPEISAFEGLNTKIYVVDAAGNAGANNITINRAGSDTIDDAQTSVLIDSDDQSVALVMATKTGWKSL